MRFENCNQFNRYTLTYSADAAVHGTLTYYVDDALYSEEFFLDSSSNTCSLSTCHMVGKVLEVEEETLNRSDQAPVLLEMMSWWTRPMVIK